MQTVLVNPSKYNNQQFKQAPIKMKKPILFYHLRLIIPHYYADAYFIKIKVASVSNVDRLYLNLENQPHQRIIVNDILTLFQHAISPSLDTFCL